MDGVGRGHQEEVHMLTTLISPQVILMATAIEALALAATTHFVISLCLIWNIYGIRLSFKWILALLWGFLECHSLCESFSPLSPLGEHTPSLSSLGDHTPSLSSLGKSRRDATRGSINNDINILDSRVFADATHKNDSRMSESGRSMVEMLGTLAIIGVLSVGAIGGYSYGMDKYRANTIMNDVMLRSVDVIAQFDRTGDASLDSWPNACGIRLSFNRIPDWRQVWQKRERRIKKHRRNGRCSYGAIKKTRTSTDLSTATSTLRVYQFRHNRKNHFQFSKILFSCQEN